MSSTQVIHSPEKQRALEGLPHYWRIAWPWSDKIFADCGKHMILTRVDWLEDPDQDIITRCHYQEMGLCDG